MYKRIIKIAIACIFLGVFTTKIYAQDITVGRCAEIYDPYESVNRKIFSFNQTLDRTILRPPILLYLKVIPKWPRNRINSFFSNLMSPLTFVNNLFQGDFNAAGKTMGRFIFNSTAGLGGLIDWSKTCGVEDDPQTFDETLAKFDIPYGSYIVLPLLGPSTTRGLTGKVVDTFTDPVNFVLWNQNQHASLQYFFARKFDQRAQSEETLNIAQQNLLDEYSFVRSSYLQYVSSQNIFCKNKQDIDYELYD